MPKIETRTLAEWLIQLPLAASHVRLRCGERKNPPVRGRILVPEMEEEGFDGYTAEWAELAQSELLRMAEEACAGWRHIRVESLENNAYISQWNNVRKAEGEDKGEPITNLEELALRQGEQLIRMSEVHVRTVDVLTNTLDTAMEQMSELAVELNEAHRSTMQAEGVAMTAAIELENRETPDPQKERGLDLLELLVKHHLSGGKPPIEMLKSFLLGDKKTIRTLVEDPEIQAQMRQIFEHPTP